MAKWIRLWPAWTGFFLPVLLFSACTGLETAPYTGTVSGLSATMTAESSLSASFPSSNETALALQTDPMASLTPSPSPTDTPFPPTDLPSGPEFQLTPSLLLGAKGTLAFSLRSSGVQQLWLWPLGASDPFPVTENSSEYRDPAFSPDGNVLAFASRRDGNWELYTLSLADGSILRLTNSMEFEGHPSWSVDSKFLAYEHYSNGKFQICILSSSGGSPVWCSPDTLESYEPSWYPRERSLVFTGRMGAQTDIFSLDLDSLNLKNLTGTSTVNEHRPTLSPDGETVAYAAQSNGFTWLYSQGFAEGSKPTFSGQGDWPVWDPSGRWLAGLYYPNQAESYLLFTRLGDSVLSPAAVRLFGRVEGLDWTGVSLPNPLPAWILPHLGASMPATPTSAFGGTPMAAELASIDARAPDPRLSTLVVERFNLLRAAISEQAGWDFLASLDSAVVPLSTPLAPGQKLSWLYTGRAISISRGRTSQGFLAVVPDPLGAQEYWRLYVRAARQDGSMGEPMRELPWNFDARMSGNPDAFNRGGLPYPAVPDGYFVDFTSLAFDFGWDRFAPDPNWRSFYPSIRYWEFACTDGLDWFQAMGELYPFSKFLTPTPTNTPTPRPTWRWGPRPTDTRWPTPTYQIP